MNKINFSAKDNFPLSIETFDLMQGMITLLSSLANIGGGNYILSGCEDDGFGSYNPGVVVVNGELLTFSGGSGAKVTVKETYKNLNEFGIEYPEAYVYRNVVLSENGEYEFSAFERISTNKELKDMFGSIKGDPPGTVKMWAGLESKIPQDYKLCDGAQLMSSDFPELFEVIGVMYGGDGINYFNLPDMRSRFVVGFDNGSAKYNQPGKKGGSNTVTLTTDNIPEHKHIMPWGENTDTAWSPPWGYAEDYIQNQRGSNQNDSDNAWAYSSPVGGGNPFDVTPPYFTMTYIIKVNN